MIKVLWNGPQVSAMKNHWNIPIIVCIVEDHRQLVYLLVYLKTRPFLFYIFAPKIIHYFLRIFKIYFSRFLISKIWNAIGLAGWLWDVNAALEDTPKDRTFRTFFSEPTSRMATFELGKVDLSTFYHSPPAFQFIRTGHVWNRRHKIH